MRIVVFCLFAFLIVDNTGRSLSVISRDFRNIQFIDPCF